MTETALIRSRNVRTAIRLEIVTIGYNALEAVAALSLGFAARSASLETFGLDSLIELASGLVLVWRLNAESKGEDSETVEQVERRAARLAGISLLLLAAYVAFESLYTLFTQAESEPTLWGIGLAFLSLVVMPLLGRLKLKVADSLQSRALHADAFETIACAYLSLTLLLGLGSNYLFGWWWADPLAALVMVYFIVREAREALSGQDPDQDVREPG